MILEKGKVDFKQAVKDFWKGYVDFSGLTTRAGYWWAVLFTFVVPIAISIIAMLLAMANSHLAAVSLGLLIVVLLFGLVILIPSVTISLRRWRDAGLSNKGVVTLFVLEVIFNIVSIWWNDFGNWMLIITGLISFILTLLPTNQLVTTSNNVVALFLFRKKN